jgi:hypothetical protein
VKPEFEPSDTLADVVKRVAEAIEENKAEDADNSTDKSRACSGICPPSLCALSWDFLRSLDNVGKLPRAIQSASPFTPACS